MGNYLWTDEFFFSLLTSRRRYIYTTSNICPFIHLLLLCDTRVFCRLWIFHPEFLSFTCDISLSLFFNLIIKIKKFKCRSKFPLICVIRELVMSVHLWSQAPRVTAKLIWIIVIICNSWFLHQMVYIFLIVFCYVFCCACFFFFFLHNSVAFR